MKKQVLGGTLGNWYRKIIRHPKYRNWVLLGTLVYFLSPVDISPDVFPVVGWIDDGLIATIAVAEVSQLLLERRRKNKLETQSANAFVDTEGTVVDVESVAVR